MNTVELIILAIVQGLTEFIPVSSSGHLVLLEHWFGQKPDVALEVTLHIGTLGALLLHFRGDIASIVQGLGKNDASAKKMTLLLIMGTLPVLVLGAVYDAGGLDESLRGPGVVVTMLILVSGLMLWADKQIKKNRRDWLDLTPRKSLVVGLFQAISLFPGSSRSGTTMVGSVWAGLSAQAAARFSFLLAIPSITAAATWTLLRDGGRLLDNYQLSQLLMVVVVSGVTGWLAIRFMLKVIGLWGLKPFAIYRIGLAVLVLFTVVL